MSYQELNPHPVQKEGGALTSGPLGKSLAHPFTGQGDHLPRQMPWQLLVSWPFLIHWEHGSCGPLSATIQSSIFVSTSKLRPPASPCGCVPADQLGFSARSPLAQRLLPVPPSPWKPPLSAPLVSLRKPSPYIYFT